MQSHSWNKTTSSPPSDVAAAQSDDTGLSLLLHLAECECRGGSCDPRTGECTCSNGLTGKQCDVCMHDYEIPVANGPDSMRCEGLCPAVLGNEVREAPGEGPVLSAAFPWQYVIAVSCFCWRICRASRCPCPPSATSWSTSTPAPSPGLASTVSTVLWQLSLCVQGRMLVFACACWPVGLISAFFFYRTRCVSTREL